MPSITDYNNLLLNISCKSVVKILWMLHFSLFFICFSSAKKILFYLLIINNPIVYNLGAFFLLGALGNCISCSTIQPPCNIVSWNSETINRNIDVFFPYTQVLCIILVFKDMVIFASMTKISLIQKKCFIRQSNKTSLSQHMQFAIVRIASVRSPHAASVSARPSQIPQSVPCRKRYQQ